jgi:hypothetical protein
MVARAPRAGGTPKRPTHHPHTNHEAASIAGNSINVAIPSPKAGAKTNTRTVPNTKPIANTTAK